jgi:hypothetical protein
VRGPLHVGKLDRQGRLNAVPGSLVHIVDQLSNSNRRFLINTGASYSIFPHHSSATPSGPSLRGAAGQPFPCWGKRTLALSFHGRKFSWTFLLAAVSFPIIGVDFLGHHLLMVDPAANTLVDRQSKECFATVSTLMTAQPPTLTPAASSSVTGFLSHRPPQSPASSVTASSVTASSVTGLLSHRPPQSPASSVTGLSSHRFQYGGRVGGGSGQLCTAAGIVPGGGQQL